MSFTQKLCSAALLACAASLSVAQTSVNFKPYTSTAGETPAGIYAVDLNGDGFTDILQDAGLASPAFNVSLRNGNGTFKAPVTYSIPSSSRFGGLPMVTADFNNDGKVDIAVMLIGENKVAVYLGNGNGTFQSPKISTINLPSGWMFSTNGVAAADLNGDGKIDLATWPATNNAGPATNFTALYTLQGDGAGGFSNPQHILSGPYPQGGFQVFAGDFDADGKVDLVATDYTLDRVGDNQNTQMHVCYGNGNFTFDCTVPYTAAHGPFQIGAGDLNSDGISDVYALTNYGGVTQLAAFYGETSRTFKSYFNTLSNNYNIGASPTGTYYNSQFAMADFNGDGRMDLVSIGMVPHNNGTFTEYALYFLAGANPGEFTMQPIALPASYIWETEPVVGLFGSSLLKPDMALNQSPNGGSPPQNTPSYLVAEVNQAASGWFGPCAYLRKGQGFNVCSAGTPLNGKTLFSVSANSFGKLRKIELWVDGKKVQEQHHTWDLHGYFNWSGAFAAGTHHATFYAADVDNRLQRDDFTFIVR